MKEYINLPEVIEYNGERLHLWIRSKGDYAKYAIEYRTKPYNKKESLYRLNTNFSQCVRDMQEYLKELEL